MSSKHENSIPPWHRLLVDRQTAAAMFGFSESTLQRHVEAGRLPGSVKVGGSTRWRVSDLEPFKDSPPKTPHERRPKSVALAPGVTHLYRHFDGTGQLLYVGISLSAIARLGEHKASSHWFWQIARIEVTAYASRASATKAERITILREKPLHNIQHARTLA